MEHAATLPPEEPLPVLVPEYRREHKARVGALAELMAGHCVTVKARRIDARTDSPADDWHKNALHCAVDVLHNGRKVYSFEYSAGLGAAWPDTLKQFGEAVKRGRFAMRSAPFFFPHDVTRAFKAGWQKPVTMDLEQVFDCFRLGWQPNPVDLIQSVLSDCTEESFEDWCAELGMDTDSRRAERAWNAGRECDRVSRQIFGRDYEDARRIASEF